MEIQQREDLCRMVREDADAAIARLAALIAESNEIGLVKLTAPEFFIHLDGGDMIYLRYCHLVREETKEWRNMMVLQFVDGEKMRLLYHRVYDDDALAKICPLFNHRLTAAAAVSTTCEMLAGYRVFVDGKHPRKVRIVFGTEDVSIQMSIARPTQESRAIGWCPCL